MKNSIYDSWQIGKNNSHWYGFALVGNDLMLSHLSISRNIFDILIIPKINKKKILKIVMFMSFQIVSEMETMTKQDKDSNIRNKLNGMIKHFDFIQARSRFIGYNTSTLGSLI